MEATNSDNDITNDDWKPAEKKYTTYFVSYFGNFLLSFKEAKRGKSDEQSFSTIKQSVKVMIMNAVTLDNVPRDIV